VTGDAIREVLALVRFGNWRFVVVEDAGAPYLQCFFCVNGQEWSGRKWKLSFHMTRSEIVQTALKAVLTAVEHEVREQFLYRGKPIFGPHLDVDRLWDIAEDLDVRDRPLIDRPRLPSPSLADSLL
jgi:hypothetical protein